MQDQVNPLDTPLDGLGWNEWLGRMQDLADEDGYAQNLGDHHGAIFLEHQPNTLLVTFENFNAIKEQSEIAHPMGWQMIRALDWSHLCLVSNGDTWFRDPRVFGYFDRLVDDGFFEDFDQVIFYGAGSCGYAAAAFSVAAPGAKVLALQPQATLDPRVTEWDNRFRPMRRVNFEDRYGYAPDMLDAASEAFVIYDPAQQMDAMHAALFTRDNVTKVRARFLGAQLETSLQRIQVLYRMLAQISANKLAGRNLHKLMRERRNDPAFQFNLLRHCEDNRRYGLVTMVCNKVLERREAPPFRKALARAERRQQQMAEKPEGTQGDG